MTSLITSQSENDLPENVSCCAVSLKVGQRRGNRRDETAMGREPRRQPPQQVLLLWTVFFWCGAAYPQMKAPMYPVRYPGGVRNLSQAVAPRPERVQGMVIFPDEGGNPLAPPLDMDGNPTCASGSSKATFCENVDYYPSDEIRHLIRLDKSSFQDLFGPVGINSRRTINSDELTEEGVCKHQRQTFYPKMAKNDQNLWRYVINDVDYVQAVEAEVCAKEGKACSYVQNSLPGGHQSFCRQRFSFKRLLAIDPDQKKTYLDSFRFASCCSCYVKVPSLYERSGRIKATTRFPNRNR